MLVRRVLDQSPNASKLAAAQCESAKLNRTYEFFLPEKIARMLKMLQFFTIKYCHSLHHPHGQLVDGDVEKTIEDFCWAGFDPSANE